MTTKLAKHTQTLAALLLGAAIAFVSCSKDEDDDDDKTGETTDGTTNGTGTGTGGDPTPAGVLTLDLSANCGDQPCL